MLGIKNMTGLNLSNNDKSERINYSQKDIESSLDYLKHKEALFDWELPTCRKIFNILNEQQKVAKIEVEQEKRTQTMYALPEIIIKTGIMMGHNDLKSLSNWCNLRQEVVLKLLENDSMIDSNSKPFHINNSGKLLIFDWSNTLVDEHLLDDAICEYIISPKKGNSKSFYQNKSEFLELLSDLEKKNSHLWYDYIFLGNQFEKTPKDLEKEHGNNKNKSKITPLCDISKLVNHFKKLGYKTALATNCIREVLKWRADMLELNLGELFNYIITSDKIQNLKDKNDLLVSILETSEIDSKDCILISNSFEKDILPAKILGMQTVWIKNNKDKKRSKWGTSALPPNSNQSLYLRYKVNDTASDFIINSVKQLENIIRTPIEQISKL